MRELIEALERLTAEFIEERNWSESAEAWRAWETASLRLTELLKRHESGEKD